MPNLLVLVLALPALQRQEVSQPKPGGHNSVTVIRGLLSHKPVTPSTVIWSGSVLLHSRHEQSKQASAAKDAGQCPW